VDHHDDLYLNDLFPRVFRIDVATGVLAVVARGRRSASRATEARLARHDCRTRGG
jgi:hypothetical protein